MELSIPNISNIRFHTFSMITTSDIVCSQLHLPLHLDFLLFRPNPMRHSLKRFRNIKMVMRPSVPALYDIWWSFLYWSDRRHNFLWHKVINEYTSHLVISDDLRPWSTSKSRSSKHLRRFACVGLTKRKEIIGEEIGCLAFHSAYETQKYDTDLVWPRLYQKKNIF